MTRSRPTGLTLVGHTAGSRAGHRNDHAEHARDRHGSQQAAKQAEARAHARRGETRQGETRQGERAALLSRPLASYYLLLSTAGLLVVFGLVMVLSSSSVTAYAANKSPY
ncbi:MAG: hypothetical protein ACXVHI_02460, partial [Frankiaceae bacterium]